MGEGEVWEGGEVGRESMEVVELGEAVREERSWEREMSLSSSSSPMYQVVLLLLPCSPSSSSASSCSPTSSSRVLPL